VHLILDVMNCLLIDIMTLDYYGFHSVEYMHQLLDWYLSLYQLLINNSPKTFTILHSFIILASMFMGIGKEVRRGKAPMDFNFFYFLIKFLGKRFFFSFWVGKKKIQHCWPPVMEKSFWLPLEKSTIYWSPL